MPAKMDHVADTSGAELYRYFQLYGDVIPEFVKKANFEQVMRPRELSAAHYADPRPGMQQFRCDTAVSTYLSALYYNEKKAEFHPKDQARIEQRLDHYVDYWHIRPHVEKLLAKQAGLKKQAGAELPDSAYAYVWVGEDGTKDRQVLITTAAQVKQAADWLAAYRDRFPFQERCTIARKILAKAAAFGASVGDKLEFLEKQAGRGVSDPDEVTRLIENRARMATVPAFREHITKLAATVRSLPRMAVNPDDMVKLAGVIYDIDQHLKIKPESYGEVIPRPEDVIFKATFSKVASDLAEKVATTSGKVYNKAKLSKLALDDLRSLFGDDFADEVKTAGDKVDAEKLAELVHTLPRPDAELFDKLCADCGLHPDMQKAASAKIGFTPAQFAEIAKHYG